MKAPQQKSFINLFNGSMGETTFVRRNGKFTVREKRVPSPGERKPMNLENESEFGTASSAGKLLRLAVINFKLPKSSERINRIQKLMRKITKLDTVSIRGERNITLGDRSLLLGFDFNIKSGLRSAFKVRFTTSINRETGELIITIPSFIPRSAIKVPLGTTLFKIISIGAAINFANKKSNPVREIIESTLIPWDTNSTAAITNVHHVPPNTTDALFLFLGLQFFKDGGPEVEKVKMGNGDCLCVVAVG